MLDPDVGLTLVSVVPAGNDNQHDPAVVQIDQERARQLGRELEMLQPEANGELSAEIVRMARAGKYDLVILGLKTDASDVAGPTVKIDYVVKNAHCRVFIASTPGIPQEVEG